MGHSDGVNHGRIFRRDRQMERRDADAAVVNGAIVTHGSQSDVPRAPGHASKRSNAKAVLLAGRPGHAR
jgi:hypothetical protein